MQEQLMVPSIVDNDGVTWPILSPLSIITGKNGSGKTRLLKSIAERFQRSNPNDVVYVDVHYRFDQVQTRASHDVAYHLRDLSSFAKEISGILESTNWADEATAETAQQQKHAETIAFEMNSLMESGHLSEDRSAAAVEQYIIDTVDFSENLTGVLGYPMSILTQVCKDYYDVEEQLRSHLNSRSSILKLYFFWLDNDAIVPKVDGDEPLAGEVERSEAAFFLAMSLDSTFLDRLTDAFIKSSLTFNPINEMNDTLSRYHFKYRLNYDSDKKQIYFTNGVNSTIQPAQLSSGEMLAVAMLSWLFYHTGFQDDLDLPKLEPTPIKLMILDEPDKHLDPDLCKLFFDIVHKEFVQKHGIQVIMSSHRIDTVTLAPSNSLFTIKTAPDGARHVEPVHKLTALFRMTKNIRSLIDYEHRVYTESTNDCFFFQGAYRSLRETLCDPLRERYKAEGRLDATRHRWVPDPQGAQSYRLLSRRYRIGFYTSSTDGKSGGSCKQVKNLIKRDDNAINSLAHGQSNYRHCVDLSRRWRENRHVLDRPCFFSSFGVVDRDYDVDHKLPEEQLENRVVVLQRHSLDNFVLDPVVFCSVLTQTEFDYFILGGMSALESKNPAATKTLKADLIAACQSVKTALEEPNFPSLQEALNRYFKTLTNVFIEHMQHIPSAAKASSFKKEVPLIQALKDRQQQGQPICDKPIQLIHLPSAQVFTCHYPSEFLLLQGHYMESFVTKKNKGSKDESPVDLIAERVFDQGLTVMPADLAEVFFSLNDQVRDYVKAEM